MIVCDDGEGWREGRGVLRRNYSSRGICWRSSLAAAVAGVTRRRVNDSTVLGVGAVVAAGVGVGIVGVGAVVDRVGGAAAVIAACGLSLLVLVRRLVSGRTCWSCLLAAVPVLIFS